MSTRSTDIDMDHHLTSIDPAALDEVHGGWMGQRNMGGTSMVRGSFREVGGGKPAGVVLTPGPGPVPFRYMAR
jgi:hypothetical protein